MLHDLESAAPGGASDSKSTARAKKLFAAMDSDQKRSNSSTETDAFDRKLSDQQSAKQFTAPFVRYDPVAAAEQRRIFLRPPTAEEGHAPATSNRSTRPCWFKCPAFRFLGVVGREV